MPVNNCSSTACISEYMGVAATITRGLFMVRWNTRTDQARSKSENVQASAYFNRLSHLKLTNIRASPGESVGALHTTRKCLLLVGDFPPHEQSLCCLWLNCFTHKHTVRTRHRLGMLAVAIASETYASEGISAVLVVDLANADVIDVSINTSESCIQSELENLIYGHVSSCWHLILALALPTKRHARTVGGNTVLHTPVPSTTRKRKLSLTCWVSVLFAIIVHIQQSLLHSDCATELISNFRRISLCTSVVFMISAPAPADWLQVVEPVAAPHS